MSNPSKEISAIQDHRIVSTGGTSGAHHLCHSKGANGSIFTTTRPPSKERSGAKLLEPTVVTHWNPPTAQRPSGSSARRRGEGNETARYSGNVLLIPTPAWAMSGGAPPVASSSTSIVEKLGPASYPGGKNRLVVVSSASGCISPPKQLRTSASNEGEEEGTRPAVEVQHTLSGGSASVTGGNRSMNSHLRSRAGSNSKGSYGESPPACPSDSSTSAFLEKSLPDSSSLSKGGQSRGSKDLVLESLGSPHLPPVSSGRNTKSPEPSPRVSAGTLSEVQLPPLDSTNALEGLWDSPPTHLTPTLAQPRKMIRPPEEDLLSDISISDTLSQPSSTNSLTNKGLGARVYKGDEIEQERNRMPLNIEEDLFVYDDIVISKDETRSKQWRVAGRKRCFEVGSRRSSSQGTGGGASNTAAGAAAAEQRTTTTFSFNDFDVCVDEMDIGPLTPISNSAVNAFTQDTASPGVASPLTSSVSISITADMSVTWTQMRQPALLAGTMPKEPEPPTKNRPLLDFSCETLRGHASRVKCISLSPTEKEYVSCSNEDASVVLNSRVVGDEVGIFTSHQETVICTAFSPDGKLLATSSKDRSMKLWDVMTTKLLLTYNHSKVVICCCFSPDSRYVVSGCQDRVCRLWDTRRGKEWLAYSQHEGIIISVAFSPDSNYICSASADSTLRVWSATTAKTAFVLTGHKGIILSCSYTSDGEYIVSNDESQVRVWSTHDGSCQLSITPEMLLGASTFTTAFGEQRLGWTLSAAGPGGFTDYILVACSNRFVYVLDRRTGKEVVSTFCKSPVYCLSSGWKETVACGDSFGNIYMLHLK